MEFEYRARLTVRVCDVAEALEMSSTGLDLSKSRGADKRV